MAETTLSCAQHILKQTIPSSDQGFQDETWLEVVWHQHIVLVLR